MVEDCDSKVLLVKLKRPRSVLDQTLKKFILKHNLIGITCNKIESSSLKYNQARQNAPGKHITYAIFALAFWTIAIYIYNFNQCLKKPQSHFGNLSNYTWDKESYLQEMSVSNASKSLNYRDIARRFNLRNKQGNFYKYSSGTPKNLRSYLHPSMKNSVGNKIHIQSPIQKVIKLSLRQFAHFVPKLFGFLVLSRPQRCFCIIHYSGTEQLMSQMEGIIKCSSGFK